MLSEETGIRLSECSTPCPGGYSLHLYCKYENPEHGWHEFPWEITDQETRGRSIKAARESGWIFHRDNTATCPKCAKALAGRSALSDQGEREGHG